MTEIQYISDANGNQVGVIVPIEIWHEIKSEKETAYLTKSEAMKQRLLEAKQRTEDISLEETLEKLGFDIAAFEDLAWWIKQDRAKALRIVRGN